MALTAFKQFVSNNKEINWVQGNIKALIQRLTLCPLLSGNLLYVVNSPVIGAHIAHGLGRIPIGWIITDCKTANVTFCSGDFTDLILPIFPADAASGLPTSATFAVWVF